MQALCEQVELLLRVQMRVQHRAPSCRLRSKEMRGCVASLTHRSERMRMRVRMCAHVHRNCLCIRGSALRHRAACMAVS